MSARLVSVRLLCADPDALADDLYRALGLSLADPNGPVRMAAAEGKKQGCAAEVELVVEVPDVRKLHEARAKLGLDFAGAPTARKNGHGHTAIARDSRGFRFRLVDRQPAELAAEKSATSRAKAEAKTGALFGDALPPEKHAPDERALAAAYARANRTADDLPYTPEFEAFYDEYAGAFADPRPDHAEVWRHLLAVRKKGRLPRLGAAATKPPEVSDEDAAKLRELLGPDLGKRDRLPYTRRFDEIAEAFNRKRRPRLSPHLLWRALTRVAK